MDYKHMPSVWTAIRSRVSASEVDEVKQVLGESLVEQVGDLQQELGSLLDTQQAFRTSQKSAEAVPLPEPPALRSHLMEEVRLFVDLIRQQAALQGRDGLAELQHRHPQHILDYCLSPASRVSSGLGSSSSECSLVLDEPSRATMASSANSDYGYSLASRPSTTSSSRLVADVAEELHQMTTSLSTDSIDEIADHLRQALEEECEQLEADIICVQDSLVGNAKHLTGADCEGSTEPTLQELRRLGTELQQEVLHASTATILPSASEQMMQRRLSGRAHRLEPLDWTSKRNHAEADQPPSPNKQIVTRAFSLQPLAKVQEAPSLNRQHSVGTLSPVSCDPSLTVNSLSVIPTPPAGPKPTNTRPSRLQPHSITSFCSSPVRTQKA